jgi:hypothetical protein
MHGQHGDVEPGHVHFACAAKIARTAEIDRNPLSGRRRVEIPLAVPVLVQAANVGRRHCFGIVHERREPSEQLRHAQPALVRVLDIEERAVQPERAHAILQRAFMLVQAADQSAGGMPGKQHVAADFLQRAREVVMVLGDVLAEARVLVRQQRAAVLAQVERVEGIAFGRKALRHVALEEIVDEAMHVEHRTARRVGRGQAHQRRHHAPVVVVGSRQLERLEARQQAVRLPGHAASVPRRRARVRAAKGGLLFLSGKESLRVNSGHCPILPRGS